MQIFCRQCGRPLAEIDFPAISSLEGSIIKRFLGAIPGVDAASVGPLVEAATQATPEGLVSHFNIRCVNEQCPP